ncbi:hypothetical protein [Antarcticirhabdus aurantiaca]|uniref:hypothetical protein n=1 Tax=Antarcticirhabdus aurantiaca TaxID=2606717 RepID=UPI00131C03DE|nr:hypothetical protein [Antarcticirhabdus aurantiaca]
MIEQTVVLGLPANGASGQFVGFDADGNAYIVQWSDVFECFSAIGFDPKDKRLGFVINLREEDAGFIASHALPPNVLTSEDA